MGPDPHQMYNSGSGMINTCPSSESFQKFDCGLAEIVQLSKQTRRLGSTKNFCEMCSEDTDIGQML